MEVNNSLLHTGLSGMNRGRSTVAEAAQDIASGTAVSEGSGDLATSIVELKEGQHLFEASAKVVNVADEMLGTLLDITA
ncbi:flagellar basal body rod C-terminal domain-containing protein [Zooshikella harenae]|uniref:Flagellar biosynthesis protein FlgE n=1 Tax=Zooshikella harenae TaxID=2827238 RepID=A0ABS5ZDB8_9GAMM|nr:flagellar basal body rod C-terminal domain-containing protein [Zooshikella harenae]MBU2711974.1 flagellar biosynthesis protein FlgE [Zooshikella harenae]